MRGAVSNYSEAASFFDPLAYFDPVSYWVTRSFQPPDGLTGRVDPWLRPTPDSQIQPP